MIDGVSKELDIKDQYFWKTMNLPDAAFASVIKYCAMIEFPQKKWIAGNLNVTFTDEEAEYDKFDNDKIFIIAEAGVNHN